MGCNDILETQYGSATALLLRLLRVTNTPFMQLFDETWV